jgi:SAM-dependent methyltransferase
MAMEWVRDFYSTTGEWWGAAEARITDRDHRRVDLLRRIAGDRSQRILELGCGYGATAAAMAQAGHTVTGVEISDRVAFAEQFVATAKPGRLSILQQDFYETTLPEPVDAVCYWNGFGVGTDSDQRRLLHRICTEWLRPDGIALIDIFNPFVWARWDGDDDSLEADPARGYRRNLSQHIEFSPVTCSATDTWWETGDPSRKISQTLRCYTPADLRLLLDGTGLRLDQLVVGDDMAGADHDFRSLLQDHYEYVAVLRPILSRPARGGSPATADADSL